MTTTRLGTALHRVDVFAVAGRPLGFTVSLDDGADEPLAAALVGSARAQVRSRAGTVLHTFDTVSGNLLVADGVLAFSATSEQTSTWSASWAGRTGWWDLEVTDVNGVAWQVLAPGRFSVTEQVTR